MPKFIYLPGNGTQPAIWINLNLVTNIRDSRGILIVSSVGGGDRHFSGADADILRRFLDRQATPEKAPDVNSF